MKTALEAEKILVNYDIKPTILHVPTVKPLDKKTLLACLKQAKIIITVEEGTIFGGLGRAVAEVIVEANFKEPKKFKRIGVSDEFPVDYGTQITLMEKYHITAKEIVKIIDKL